MRLADDLARRRVIYPRPLPTLPDIVLIDLSPRFRSPSLPLGRYYPVIVETDRERVEWDAFLDAERPAPVAPDLLDRRPSALATARISFAHYDPPAPGWPWILLCHWPDDHVAIVGTAGDLFARRAYTIELATDPAARTTMQDGLFAALGCDVTIDIILVPPSPVAGTG